MTPTFFSAGDVVKLHGVLGEVTHVEPPTRHGTWVHVRWPHSDSIHLATTLRRVEQGEQEAPSAAAAAAILRYLNREATPTDYARLRYWVPELGKTNRKQNALLLIESAERAFGPNDPYIQLLRENTTR